MTAAGDILTYVPGRTNAMTRSQDRILLHSAQAIWDARYPAAQRAWGEEAVRWASADQELIRASEQVLLAALR